MPSTKKERELSNHIKEKVNQILNSKNQNETKALQLQNQIDLLVSNLYKINEDDYHHILNSLDNLVKNKK